jgi:hypothetical protein
MSLAEQLDKALQEPEDKVPREGERVRLGIGQFVEVRTREGDLVITGTIQELSPVTHTIRVADTGSGADVQVDVDPDVYDIWVTDMPVPGGAPTPSKQPDLNIGAFTPGKRYRVYQ